jgi:parallel beta-helix repeat protein
VVYKRQSYGNAIPSVDFWNQQITYLKTFADTRPGELLTDLVTYGAGQPATLTLSVSPTNGGTIALNGFTIPDASWTGSYSTNLQLQLTATEKPGFTFKGWANSNSPGTIISTSKTYTFTLTSAAGYVAVFQATTGQSILPATITANTTLTRSLSPYLAQGDVTINKNCTVTIEAGVEIWMPKDANIFINGNIRANGTAAAPIIFKLNAAYAGSRWGALCFDTTTAASTLTYVTVENASAGPIPTKYVAAISGWHTSLTLDHITVENVFCNPVATRYSDIVLTNSSLRIKDGFVGDVVNVKYGNARIENCTLRGGDTGTTDTDAIDFDSVPTGSVKDCRIFSLLGENNDGMDMGGRETNVTLENNLVYNVWDKGVSVGQKANITIKNCTFVNCGAGAGLKDLSNTTIDHCTYYGCHDGIHAYEKALGRRGGNGTVTNSIISNTAGDSYDSDGTSALSIKYSIADNTMLPAGSSNLFGDPMFVDPVRYDFNLQSSSPCRNAGSDGQDMGTLFHNYTGGEPSVMISGIYYNLANDAAKTEFITLYNPGSQSVDLSGYKISKGVEYTFPAGKRLGAGESFIISKASGITLKGSSPNNAAQWDSGSLADEGEKIQLENRYGSVIDYIDYKVAAPWPVVTGTADVLILKNYSLDNHLPDSWSLTAYNNVVN